MSEMVPVRFEALGVGVAQLTQQRHHSIYRAMV